jgi:hypothetical protein
MNTEKIINEWFYRLPNGYANYPYSDEELTILHKVLEENDFQLDQAFLDAKPVKEVDEDIPFDELLQKTLIAPAGTGAGFDDNITIQIIDTYNGLSDSEQAAFQKNFRKHTIQSYVSAGYKPFIKFFNIVPTGKAAAGMGRGEVPVVLGAKDVSTGGTAQHDIVMKNGKEWEVKELTNAYSFDPAKYGAVTRYDLTYLMQDFYNTIVVPFTEIEDQWGPEALKGIVDPGSHDKIDELIEIFTTHFSNPVIIDKVKPFTEISYTIWQNWYAGFRLLNKIFYKEKLDIDVRDTRLSTNIDGDKKSYWISDDEAEKIDTASGDEAGVAIKVGDIIDDENKDIVIWFKRIERFDLIRNPGIFIEELNEIKEGFFAKLLGLIYYYKGDTTPHIGTAEMFATTNVTKSNYRFRYKEKVANLGKYPFISDQS